MVARRHTREDSGLYLDANLVWWHDGERVEHPGISRAFTRGLCLGDGGELVLRIGDDWCVVKAEDVAFEVERIEATSAGEVLLHISNGAVEGLDAATLQDDRDGALRCRVFSGRALARFSRQAHLELARMLELDGADYVLCVGERRLAVPALSVGAELLTVPA